MLQRNPALNLVLERFVDHSDDCHEWAGRSLAIF